MVISLPYGLAAQTVDGIPPVKSYTSFLSSLDKDNFDNLYAGIQYFKSHMVDLPQTDVDSACQAFMTFFFATISHHNDQLWEDYDLISRFHDDQGRREPDIRNYIDALRRNGLDLFTFGRLYYIDQQSEFLYRNFTRYVSPAVRYYLALRSEELAEGFSDNDSLTITFRQVGERVIRWEQYRQQYPASVVSDYADYYYQLYLSTYVTGLKLSPVFDDQGSLRSELSTVYHEFASRHPESQAGFIVKEFYRILQVADFKWSPAVRHFYERRRIRNMHIAQVPYR
ncbi:hypothetical protein ACFL5M_02145 [Candidatus Neomarinimicrobiota bacterium]